MVARHVQLAPGKGCCGCTRRSCPSAFSGPLGSGCESSRKDPSGTEEAVNPTPDSAAQAGPGQQARACLPDNATLQTDGPLCFTDAHSPPPSPVDLHLCSFLGTPFSFLSPRGGHWSQSPGTQMIAHASSYLTILRN